MPRPAEIEPLEWGSEFLPFMKENWLPGEHIGVIAPTGEGKTTFTGGLTSYCRRYVLTLDAKGHDSTLDGLGHPRLEKWPGKKAMLNLLANNDEEEKPSRYIIGSQNRTITEEATLYATIKACLIDIYEMGGWTVNADELRILTDPELMGLRRYVNRILIAARDRGISFVSAFQGPTWVPPNASLQATWIAIARTRDRDVVNRLSEILGRPRAEIQGAVGELDPHHFIVANRNSRQPLLLTKPDYIAPGSRPA